MRKKLQQMVREPAGRLFLAGLLPFFGGLLYVLVYFVFHYDLYRLVPFRGLPCQFRKLTGLYCPGCGGTRAFLYLLKGRPLKSLYYHPVPLYGLLLYLNFMIRYIFSKLVPPACPVHLKPARPRTFYLVLLVVLLLGNWIFRLVLLFRGIPTV